MTSLFTFQISDVDALSPTFSCLAESAEAAEQLVRAAGYQDFVLVEVTPHRVEEEIRKAQHDLLQNPLLGPNWRPFIDSLAESFRELHPGEFWTISWFGKSVDESPYCQALYESDGSLLVEIGPTELLDSAIGDKEPALSFLGWDLPGHHPKLPNYLRFFEPGWNLWGVGAFALQSLVLLGVVDEGMLFKVNSSAASDFDPENRLKKVPIEIGDLQADLAYGLPNAGKRSPASSNSRMPKTKKKPGLSNSHTLYPLFSYENPGLGSAFSFNTVWPPREEGRKGLRTDDCLQLRLSHPFYTDEVDELAIEDEWGDEFLWTWGAVSAFRSLADPGAPLPFPGKGEQGVLNPASDIAPGYWSTLLALCYFRLGWSRPGWGIVEWLSRRSTFRDPTLEYIRQHWSIANLKVFVAWAESLGTDYGSPLEQGGKRAEPSRFLKRFLNRYGYYEDGHFVWEQETVLNNGGRDALHLTRHLPGSWLANDFTHRVRDAMPVKKVGPSRDMMALESGRSWFDWVINWGELAIESKGIGWIGNPGEPVCDVYVEPIGLMGTYRLGFNTGIPYATTERIHHFGNPKGDGTQFGPGPYRWDTTGQD